jgi:hypothetical protein
MQTRAKAGYAASWTTEGMSGETTVTEAEWLSGSDPDAMLKFLRGKVSYRKLRLFLIGCSRFIWEKIIDEDWRAWIHKAEHHADGLLNKESFDEVGDFVYRQAVEQRFDGRRTPEGAIPSEVQAWGLFRCTLFGHAGLDSLSSMSAWSFAKPLVSPQQAILLHDIFGPLLFRSITIFPAVLAWNDGLVVHLAQAAYDERHLPSGTLDNGRLAILADALDEAGCTDEDILGHLRGSDLHVRGCWPVDLVLGKS